ncbi:MAG: hypothetical protein EBU66_18885, partial [Bacteroidetes bacterium]|nr:hypothetical protein [bacterium]NBP66699.1 hypothetical protein [Bacteroidota bacterium]
IKFPNQIRISGWDFGSSARAMNQMGGVISTQAELVKVISSTTERKSMSTKTTIKRIALVAVSALGLGMISTVSATAGLPGDKTLISGVSIATPASIVRAGVSTGSLNISLTAGSNYTVATGSTLEINTYVKFSSVPSGETVLGVTSSSTQSPTLAVATTTAGSLTASAKASTVTAPSGVTPGYVQLQLNAGSALVKGTDKVGTLSFTPMVAGTYKVQAWVDDATAGNSAGVLDAAERTTTKTIVVGGAPTAIVATALNATSGAVGGYAGTSNLGTVYQISITDAAGNKTAFLPGEALSVAASSGTVSDASLTSGDFNANGFAYVTITGSADTNGTLTVTAVGFTATTITKSYSASLTNAQAASVTLTQTTGLQAGSAGAVNTALTANAEMNFATGKAVTLRVTSGSSASATSRVIDLNVNDNSGDVSGDDSGSVSYSLAVAIDDTLGYGSVTLPTAGLVAGDSITVTWAKSNGTDYTLKLTAADIAVSSVTSTISPSSANIVTGGGITLTAQALDQYSQPVAGAAVSWTVTGRNATTAPTVVLADANGYSTYTLTDTSTSTTVLTSTVTATFTYGTSTSSSSSTISFAAGNAPSAIAVTTSPTKTVATTESAISTAATGPEAGAVTLAFTVTDANGVAISGTPVTFTADSSNVVFKSSYLDTSNRKLAYTSSTGVATTYIAGWVAPSTVTITATAGTKTVTTKVNFVTVAADARTVALSETGGVAKATVKDRFGNPVKGATVNFSRTSGTGWLGAGVSSQDVVTNASGEAEILVNGTATIKAGLAVATYAQVDDAAGYVGTTATSGTGASLAPAGIASATLEVTGNSAASDALDAANEATDAANAATDAANAA